MRDWLALLGGMPGLLCFYFPMLVLCAPALSILASRASCMPCGTCPPLPTTVLTGLSMHAKSSAILPPGAITPRDIRQSQPAPRPYITFENKSSHTRVWQRTHARRIARRGRRNQLECLKRLRLMVIYTATDIVKPVAGRLFNEDEFGRRVAEQEHGGK